MVTITGYEQCAHIPMLDYYGKQMVVVVLSSNILCQNHKIITLCCLVH